MPSSLSVVAGLIIAASSAYTKSLDSNLVDVSHFDPGAVHIVHLDELVNDYNEKYWRDYISLCYTYTTIDVT